MKKVTMLVNGKTLSKGGAIQPTTIAPDSRKQVPVTFAGSRLTPPSAPAPEPANLVHQPVRKKGKKKAKLKQLPSGRVPRSMESKEVKARRANKNRQQSIAPKNSGIVKGLAARIMAEAIANNRPLAIDGAEPHKLMSKAEARRFIRQEKKNAIAAAQLPEDFAPAVATSVITVEAPQLKVAANNSKPEEIRFFDTEAYKIAIRLMTSGEAWKMAHDPEASAAFMKSRAPAAAPETKPAPAKAAPVTTVKASDFKATGSVQVVEVKQRLADEQADFKRRVRNSFFGRCAISGDTSSVNQGCHLEPFAVNRDNSTSNGILLSPTFHTMLDRGLLGINPETLTIHFAEEGIFKTMFEGKHLQAHTVELNKAALATIWAKFNRNR